MQNFKNNKFGNRGNILRSSLAHQKDDQKFKFDENDTYNVIGKVAQLSSRQRSQQQSTGKQQKEEILKKIIKIKNVNELKDTLSSVNKEKSDLLDRSYEITN